MVYPFTRESYRIAGNIGIAASHPSSSLGKVKGAEQWFPRRPGSAGSTRQPIDSKLLDDRNEAIVKNNDHSVLRGRTGSEGVV